MADTPKLPALPEPADVIIVNTQALRAFTAAQMLSAMAQAAREQRERDAAICAQRAERAAYSAAKNNDTSAAFKALEASDCAAAIRSQLEPVAQGEKE